MLMTDGAVRFQASYLSPVNLPPTAPTSLSTASAALVDFPIMLLMMLMLLSGSDCHY